MSLPDFTEPLSLEIELASQIVQASYSMLATDGGSDERSKLATALAYITLEHISAMLALFENLWFASGYALMRSVIETAYKCLWIAEIADDTTVARAYKGRDVYGDLKSIINALEQHFAGTEWGSMLAKVRTHVRILHERTHSGADQTLRRLRSQDMRHPEFDFSELIRDVRTLAATAILVAVPVATVEDLSQLNLLMLKNYSWLRSKTD